MRYIESWTEEKYLRAMERQQGRCFLCGRVDDKRLARDHDHKTGRSRMLLCSRCNKGLGMFADDPRLLRRAASYVEHFR